MRRTLTPAEIKAGVSISSIIGQFVKLRRSGSTFMGCCPFHQDTNPSMAVWDDSGRFKCFSCQAAGDVFEFVMRHLNVTFPEAVAIVGGEESARNTKRPPNRTDKADKIALVQKTWAKGTSLIGTVASLYLGKRGIHMDVIGNQTALRFVRLRYRSEPDLHPVLLASMTDANDRLTAVLRIYLTDEGEKLAVKTPKRSLGEVKGSAIRLGDRVDELFICEGLEDGLSLKMADPSRTIWVANGVGNLHTLPMPDECSRLILAMDNDGAGQKSIDKVREAYRRPGRTLELIRPDAAFKDFNQELLSSNRS